jgi:ATP-binding cassette, subfamily B, bacterial
MMPARASAVGNESGMSARDALRSARIAARLAWTAAPLACVASLLLMVIGGVTPGASAWLQRAVLDALAGAPARGHQAPGQPRPGLMTGHVMMLAIVLSGVALVTAMAPYARRYAESVVRRRLGFLAQDNLYAAINSFPGMSRFESPRFSDKLQLAQRVASGTGSSFVGSVLGVGQALITAVTMGLALYVISPAMAVLVAASAVPSLWAQLRNSSRQADLAWEISPNVRRQMFYARLLTDRAAAKEIRLFGLGDFLRGRMLTEMRSVQRRERTLDLRLLRVEGLLSLLSSAISAVGLLWVVWQVANGRLPIGDVAMLTVAIIGVQAAVSGGVSAVAQLAQSVMLFSHYGDLVSMAPDLTLAAEPRPVSPLAQGIVLRDVWFRYDEAHPWVLCGLSMIIPSGAAAAVVGLNGAGKSTLVKLLCRFYDPIRGSITWDGVDIREVDPSELRQRIGTVFQDYMSYDLTAAENIGMGDLALLDDRDRIRGAAELAGAEDAVLRLPRGYDTLLSRMFFGAADKENPEVGVILSGGQWQRLALARAFMRADRDLLILDEPSSGLDAQAESSVHHRMRAFRAGRTSLLISHRLSTVRDASIIYVVADGQVAEQGTHEELMAARGEYHRLFTLQANGYQQERTGNGRPSRPWAEAPRTGDDEGAAMLRPGPPSLSAKAGPPVSESRGPDRRRV